MLVTEPGSSWLTRGAAGTGKGCRDGACPLLGTMATPAHSSQAQCPKQRPVERGEAQRALPQKWLVPLCCPGEQGLLAAHLPCHSSTAFTAHHTICSWLSSVPGSQVPAWRGTELGCSQCGSKSLASRCNPQGKSQVPAARPALLLHALPAPLTRGTAPEPQLEVRRAVRVCVHTSVSASRAE